MIMMFIYLTQKLEAHSGMVFVKTMVLKTLITTLEIVS